MRIPDARWAKTGLPNKHHHPFNIILCFFWLSGVFSGQAQTNSYISSTDGFWDEPRLWSLAEPPSIAQSAILITNAASETVTIDSITASNFTSTLTISNLTVNPPPGSTNTLYLDNTGTIALHILNSFTIGTSPDYFGGKSELISTNSTLIVDGLLGGQLLDNGTMVITGGSLITTNCSLQVATDTTVGLLIISNALVQARDVTVTSGGVSSGTIEVIGGTMTLSGSLTVGNGGQISQSSMLVANGGLLVVTNADTFIGAQYESGGTLTVSNSTFLAADVSLGGARSGGQLTINNGTVTLSGQLDIGVGDQSSGGVLLNGGTLVVTNGSTSLGVGSPTSGNTLTISNGLFLARDVSVGSYEGAGAVSISGGTSVFSSNLLIGAALVSEATVFVTAGQLFVTNALILVDNQGQCDVSGGRLAAQSIELGHSLTGTLTANGGSVTVSGGITLGDCSSGGVGYASVGGGQLVVTNASGAGFIDIQNGQLILSNGVLQVDKLVMTNSCSQFIHTGGTLIVGSVILDPNAFRITSVAREGNNLLVTWLMAPGQTNALQATGGSTKSSYTTNGFTDIFIVTNNTTTGSLTNYLDIGGATNKPSRFYRARLAP
jgi:hypothetical protein